MKFSKIGLLLAAAWMMFPAIDADADQAGLWTGRVLIDKVTNTTSDKAPLEKVGSPLGLDLILHRDDGGQVRLLKDVIQMRKDDAGGTWHYVLVTDHLQIPNFKGAELRDGRQFARRLSSAAFDFDGDTKDCSGAFGATVVCAFTLAASQPTNPFLHRHHREHDNLDAQWKPITDPAAAEVYAVGRTVTLTFDTAPAKPSIGWGDSELTGTYSETLTGLHKQPLVVTGTFTLTRVSKRGKLNE